MKKQDHYDRFRAEMLSRLDPLTDDLIATLQPLLERSYPKRVQQIEFCVVEDNLFLGFPVSIVGLNQSGQEVSIRNLSEHMLDDVSPLLTDEDIIQFEAEEPEENLPSFAVDIFIEWFARCWDAAGGTNFPLDAFIRNDGSYHRYDLKQHHWADKVTGKRVKV